MNRQIVGWTACFVVLLGLCAFLAWQNFVQPRLRVPPVAAGEGYAVDSQSDSAPLFPDITMKAQAGRATVIMFHDVIKERDKNSVWFDCTVDEFKKDVDEIVADGFTVLSLDQLYDHLTKGTPIPPNSVVLTFDDNYQGFYDNALPILREHKFPAAMFVHTAYVVSKQGHPKMTWEELKQLHDENLVTIGAHTVTHPPDLKILPLDTQKKELEDSKKVLEDHLGGKIQYMAYPDGSNDA